MSDNKDFVSTGNWGDFGTVIILDAIIFGALFVLFSCLRRSNRFGHFYAPRVYSHPEDDLPNSRSLFGWIRYTVAMTEARIFELRGLDATMKVVTLRLFLFTILSLLLPIAVAVLVTNATGDEGVTGVPQISIANIGRGSNKLWVHVACGYLFTVISLFWLYKGYRIFEDYSLVENLKNLAHNYTTLVRDIPAESNLNAPNLMARQTPVKANKLRGLIQKKQALQTDQKFLRVEWEATGAVPQKKKGVACIGKNVDAIEANQQKINEKNDKIAPIRSAGFANAPATFLTFSSMRDAWETSRGNNPAVQAYPHAKPMPAPYVDDVFWKGLSATRTHRFLMTIVAVILLGLLLVFWTIPVAFVQGLANLNNIGKGGSFLSGTANWGTIPRGLIQGFLPPLVLIIFFAILPKILRAINALRGPESHSTLDRHVLASFFTFKVLNIFLVSAFGGAILNIIDQIQDGTFNIANSLGSAVPAQSLFFINLILAFAFIKYPLGLLRLGELIKTFLGRKKTPAEKAYRERPGPRNYSSTYAVELLIYALAMSYAFLAPFLLAFAALFFAMAYLSMKHEIMYVTVPRYQAKGKHWHTVFNCAIACILIAHAVFIALLGLKDFPEVAAIAPMPILTIVFTIYMKRRFHASCDYLPVERYPDTDKEAAGANFAQSYADPVTDVHRESLDLLQEEAIPDQLERGNQAMPNLNVAGSAHV
eukprot:TRINITY_DN3794_c0_g1_i2.p1 TRINITY_DN3794_c0_g1~~TRINITY_DN3794_c0_g1_i2.p1  ORF type:complete len:707 (+),score=282.23 TRINITY_DN3794_c0_g1_i2:60-2180(+)